MWVMKQLPPSENLEVSTLSRLFEQTTNSYKYLFFLNRHLTVVQIPDFSKKSGILPLLIHPLPHPLPKRS
jgi:hypothetical protein